MNAFNSLEEKAKAEAAQLLAAEKGWIASHKGWLIATAVSHVLGWVASYVLRHL